MENMDLASEMSLDLLAAASREGSRGINGFGGEGEGGEGPQDVAKEETEKEAYQRYENVMSSLCAIN